MEIPTYTLYATYLFQYICSRVQWIMSMQHAQYVLLFLVMAVNSACFQILRSCMLLFWLPVLTHSRHDQQLKATVFHRQNLQTCIDSISGPKYQKFKVLQHCGSL